MRFLLLLSALLSAMVGSGAYARPAVTLTHQAAGLRGAQAQKVAGAAQARRPETDLPRVVDRLSDDLPVAQIKAVAGLPVGGPIYAMRLRV